MPEQNEEIDTSTPKLPVKMVDIENIEETVEENPEPVDKDNARYIRELITSEAFDAATDIGSIISDLQSLIDDERVPDDVQKDAEGYLHDMEGALDHVLDHTREDFKSETARQKVEGAVTKERVYQELRTLARDQQHALRRYQTRIKELGDRVEGLERRCDSLQGKVQQMQSERDALEPLT
jgi:chromosome segregation ATPase